MFKIFSIYENINLNFNNETCLICLTKITSNQNLLSCNQCNKVLHKNCIQKWLDYKEECPYCRFKNIINLEDQNYYHHICINMYLRTLTVLFSLVIIFFIIIVYLIFIRIIY